MSDPSQLDNERLPYSLARRIDQVCDQYEIAWKEHRPPPIEDCLGAAGEPERSALLRELIRLEVYYRRARGEACCLEDYQVRFPQLDPTWLANTLAAPTPDPALTPLEGVARAPAPSATSSPIRRLRCPHCHQLQLVVQIADEVLCPGCGNSFRVREAPVDPGKARESGPDGLRYRRVRLHAAGGLGEIHIAEDTELGRMVALKRIKAECLADARNVQRFLREAQITAYLEHPGVAPVYGLVWDADGQPAYAMRFVEGETLKHAIERFYQSQSLESARRPEGGDEPHRSPTERRLAFRQLLTHFVAACNAVAYAHNRGVLHRDLKPANILLGQFGETLVVDWGLAKKVGQVDQAKADLEGTLTPAEESLGDATAMGQAVGTPAFMAPEQAAGRWDVVGPAADVYGLGATLYQLLTGRPPFRGENKFAVLALVQRGDLVPPRQVNRDVPAALEAVCRKAMALEPGQRYATAAELAREVERWLADEPVVACREPWTVRLARAARRHQTAVVGAAVFLISAVTTLAFSTGLIWREQRRTAEQQQYTQQEWSRAEDNLNVARGLALNLLDVAEKHLSKLPRTEPLRREMTDTALETVRQLLRQRPNDPDLREKTAKFYRHSANLHRLFNEVEVAGQFYTESIQLLDALIAASPQQQLYRDRLAETLRDYSQLLIKIGRLREAADILRRSIDTAEGLRADSPEQPDYQRTLAISLNDLGGVEYSRGQFAASATSSRTSADLFRNLLGVSPKESRPFDGLFLAMSLTRLAASQRELGQIEAALSTHAESLTQLRALLQRGNDQNVRHFLGRGLVEQARTLTEIPDRQSEAERDLGQALGIWEQLQKPYPDNPLYREWPAVAYEARARVRVARGRPGPAEEDLDASRRALVKLVQEFPDLPSYRGHLGRTYAALGRLALARGDGSQATDWLAQAAESLRTALERGPENALDRRSLEEIQAVR